MTRERKKATRRQTDSILKAMMKMKPIPSAALLLDIWGKAWAVNMSGFSVKGTKGKPIRSFTYRFFDGTTITWDRPE